MRNAVIFTLVFGSSFSAWGNDLSRPEAAKIISERPEFKEVTELKLPVGNFWSDWRMVDDTNQLYPLKTLQDSGILSLHETGQKQGMWSKEYVSELTQHGKELNKSLVKTADALPDNMKGMACYTVVHQPESCHPAGGAVFAMVLAKKGLPTVTGIASDSNGRLVEFTWKWIPTENGKLLQSRVPNESYNGRAQFRLYDDGWRIVAIEVQ